MSTNAFHLKIISPAAIVFDEHVAMVEIPGAEGDFGVLPQHAPFFSMLRPGVIKIHMPDGHSFRRYFAATGYADVSPSGTTILSDHIQYLGDISFDDANEALTAARRAVEEASDENERTAAQTLLTTAEALVHAVTGH